MTQLLQISSINATRDGGVYDCLVMNEAGYEVKSATLYVRILIVEQPKSQRGAAGDNITLTCRAESFPHPEYTWEKFSHDSQQYDLLLQETSTNLVLTNTQDSDFGLYRCVVTAPIINNQVTSSVASLTCKNEPIIVQFLIATVCYHLYVYAC